MARLNTSDELWAAVSEAGFLRDQSGGESDTLNAEAAAGATALTETTGTNAWVAGDYLRVESGSALEVCIVESYSTPTITLVSPLAFTHPAASVVVQQEKVNLGAVTDDGINRENAVERTEIRAVTQAGIYATLVTSVSGRISFNLLNHSMENVLAAMGIDEGNIAGTGTAADPYIGDIDFNKIDEILNHSIYFTGNLKDGTGIQVEAWNAEFDGNQTVTYLRGQAVSLPMAADVRHFRYLQPIPSP